MRNLSRLIIRTLAVATVVMMAGSASAQSPVDNPFSAARSWAYQLKNLGPVQRQAIADSPYDLMVVDYARSLDSDVDQEVPLTREEVAAMQRKPDGGRRIVIAYLSIGEAENYRYYWKPEWNKKRPAWMKGESKEWKGNYLVQYWNPDWQRIVYGNPDSFVDRILAAGFDGFYVDRSDAYYRFGDSKEARDRMVDFIIDLSKYIHARKSDAAIMIQNAEELLERPNFVAAIDAIAKEDLVFGITHREERNKKDDIEWSDNLLRAAQSAGKRIFVVEYLTKPTNIATARQFMSSHDYVLYYGPRGLFELNSKVAGAKPGPDEAPAAAQPQRAAPAAKARAVETTPRGQRARKKAQGIGKAPVKATLDTKRPHKAKLKAKVATKRAAKS